MIALGHTASGTLLGLAAISIYESGVFAEPLLYGLAFAGGIGLHYVGDVIPHGHYRFDLKKDRRASLIKLGFDLVLPILLILTLVYLNFGLGTAWWLIALAITGVQLPDVFEGLVDLKVLPKNQFAKEHRAIHYDRLHWHRNGGEKLPDGSRALGWIDLYQPALLIIAIWLVSP